MQGTRRVSDFIRFLGMAVLAIAVYQELKKPPEERTWHGKVADFVPYDLRMPTLERVKERLWNPEDPTLVQPTVFGAGWTLNFGALYRRLTNLPEGTFGPAE